MNDTLIKVEDLCKIYNPGENEVRALDHVSLEIKKGELVAIIGQSGSGKSTFMNMLGCLDVPTSGKYYLNGTDVSEMTDNELSEVRNHEIGFIFQGFNLIANLNAIENVELPLIYRGIDRKTRHELAIESLKMVGLEKRMDHKPGEMSGGQQQRVALARIMAYEPSVILLDEPFSALDVFLKDRLQQEMMELLSDYDGTVILVSHSRDEIYRFSEELLVIDDGKQICYGDTKEIFDHPKKVEAARLTGCKNIVPAERLDAHHVRIPDWGTCLHLKQMIDVDITHIGLRAHEFIPVWGEREDNCIPVKVKGKAEFPFEWKYFLKGETEESDDICWYVQKTLWAELEEKGIPDYLKLPEKEILLLK